MSDLDQQRAFVARQLAGLIIKTIQTNPPAVELSDATIVLDNIADYAFAIAQDRLAQAVCNTSAAKLTEAILQKHRGNTAVPEG